MAPEDLAGLAEIAEMLGVTRRTAQRYIARPDFPEPEQRLAGGRVWTRVDVDAWAKTNLPLPTGRPKRTSG